MTVQAQLSFEQLAKFEYPRERARRVTGGREVEFTADGTKMIAAFYGSSAQIFDLQKNVPIRGPISTAGDGEVGFINKETAYTADWEAMRLWDAKSGRQIGDSIPHEIREDTIIHPAVGPRGQRIATRATMQSVQLWQVTKETAKPIGKPRIYEAEVHSIRFFEDGEMLFVKAGPSLYAIDSESGEQVAGPIRSGWSFLLLPKNKKLVTTEPAGGGSQLVIRATDQKGWPETHRSNLPGKLTRLIALEDKRILLQVKKNDYTPVMFTLSVDEPEKRVEVESNADRAFDLVVIKDKQRWICSNIRNISCQEFGRKEPVWLKSVPPSGADQGLYPFDNEHFIIRDKNENFGVYKVADGSRIWSQSGVKRFSVAEGKIALCNRDGVEVWAVK